MDASPQKTQKICRPDRGQLLLPREEMLTALRDRDPAYDGVFWLAVRTTGIFCRPYLPGPQAPAGQRRVPRHGPRGPLRRVTGRASAAGRSKKAAGTPPEWVARAARRPPNWPRGGAPARRADPRPRHRAGARRGAHFQREVRPHLPGLLPGPPTGRGVRRAAPRRRARRLRLRKAGFGVGERLPRRLRPACFGAARRGERREGLERLEGLDRCRPGADRLDLKFARAARRGLRRRGHLPARVHRPPGARGASSRPCRSAGSAAVLVPGRRKPAARRGCAKSSPTTSPASASGSTCRSTYPGRPFEWRVWTTCSPFPTARPARTRGSRADRPPGCAARRRHGQRPQPHRDRRPLPPGGQRERRSRRLRRRPLAQALRWSSSAARRPRRRPSRPPADRRATPRFALATRPPYHATSSRMAGRVRKRRRLTTGGTE